MLGVVAWVYLFAWMSTIGGLGVLILMRATLAAVIGFFARGRRREDGWGAECAMGAGRCPLREGVAA